MMRRWSFFDLKTGEFTGKAFAAPNDDDLARNTPDGCGSKEGRYDPRSQRVDLDTLTVVDWVNAKLIDDTARREAVISARARIADLESRQLRAMREDRLRPTEPGVDGKTPRERLQAIDDEIATLRAVISDAGSTSAP